MRPRRVAAVPEMFSGSSTLTSQNRMQPIARSVVCARSIPLVASHRTLELFGVRGVIHRGFHRDQAAVDEVEQVLIEQLHLVQVAALADQLAQLAEPLAPSDAHARRAA